MQSKTFQSGADAESKNETPSPSDQDWTRTEKFHSPLIPGVEPTELPEIAVDNDVFRVLSRLLPLRPPR